jgi:hypothetical protein
MDHEEEVKRVTARSKDMYLPLRLRCTGTHLSFGSTERQGAEAAAGTPAPFPRRLWIDTVLRISIMAGKHVGLSLLISERTSSLRRKMLKKLIGISIVDTILLRRLLFDSRSYRHLFAKCKAR